MNQKALVALLGFKLVLIEATGGAKPSLVRRFVNLTYGDCTIGYAFVEHKVDLNGGLVNFHIWDTTGHKRF